MKVFPGALQTEQKIGGWREALENEKNLKDSEAYQRPTGSKYRTIIYRKYCGFKLRTIMQ